LSVFVWPDRDRVDRAVRLWAAKASTEHPWLVRLGYFGSYARGDWGVGSDLDLLAVVTWSDQPFFRRALAWNLNGLPVPAEILILTEAEWQAQQADRGRFARMLADEIVWVFSRN